MDFKLEDFDDGEEPSIANLIQIEDEIKEEKDKFNCHLCDFETNREKYLKSHIQSDHSNKENVNHSSQFSSTGKVVTVINLKVKQKKCQHCQFSTKSQIEMKKHVKENHTIETNEQLENHVQSYENDRNGFVQKQSF